MIYDCPAIDQRTTDPVAGWGSGVMLDSWMLGWPHSAPWTKEDPALPKPYDTRQMANQAQWAVDSMNQHPGSTDARCILLNAENTGIRESHTDERFANYCSAMGTSLAAIKRNAPGVLVSVYWHFDWVAVGAEKRWNAVREACHEHDAWPDRIVLSGHWRGERQVKGLYDRICTGIECIRKVEPWAPIAVLTCPWRYRSGTEERKATMRLLSDKIVGLECDEIRWYQESLCGPEGRD